MISKSQVLCIDLTADSRSTICSQFSPKSAPQPIVLGQEYYESLLMIEIYRNVRCLDDQQPTILGRVIFERDSSIEIVEKAHLSAIITQILRMEMDQLHLIGFASADGKFEHNKQLANDRNCEIELKIRENIGSISDQMKISTLVLGEGHSAQGASNARSTWIVGCTN